MGYGYPPPVYRPPGAQAGQGPPRGLLITGGVLAIIQASLLLLAGLVIAIAGVAGGSLARDIGFNRSEADVAALVGLGITLFATMAVISASFSLASRPGWTIASGVLQSVLALFWIAVTIGAGGGGAFFALLSLLACIFTFVGVGQATRRLAWKRATGG